MKKISLITAILFAFVLTSCSKDQKVVRNLEGTWTISEYTKNDVDQLDWVKDYSYQFDFCKLKKGHCPGKEIYRTTEKDFTYNISDKGEKITFFWSETNIEERTILEYSSEILKTRHTKDSDTFNTTFKKKM
jgi:hypothetical protein